MAEKLRQGKIDRSVKGNRALRNHIAAALTPKADKYSGDGICLGSVPAIRIDPKRFYPTIEKIVRGLHRLAPGVRCRATQRSDGLFKNRCTVYGDSSSRLHVRRSAILLSSTRALRQCRRRRFGSWHGLVASLLQCDPDLMRYYFQRDLAFGAYTKSRSAVPA